MDLKKLRLPILLSLTLGLAPFTPEPHIWGKLKWIAGGGDGMQSVDYFDLLLHSAPWIYLIATIVWLLVKQVQKQ